MPRPVSPLLRDYKSASWRQPRKSGRIAWFAVGLSLPLVAMLTHSGLTTPPEPDTVAPVPALTALHPDDKPYPAAAPPPASETAPPEPAYETLAFTIQKGDTLDGLFRRHDLNLGQLATISRLEEARPRFRRLKPGDELRIRHTDGDLVSLYSALDLTSALSIVRADEGFVAEIVARPIEKRKRMAHGVIATSLFEAGAAAGISDKTVMNLAGIFAWDIDFVYDIRVGDRFFVKYEEVWQDDKYVTDGEIVAAEFNNDGRTHHAIRFISANGRSDYFTPEGLSVRKAFIRAPVEFTRISSHFNPKRRHPILNTIRAHRGVDYAAPRGTPVMAAGDGKVIFRGTKSGYGKTLILQHGGNITTLYAHLSNYAKSAPLGARVVQGQTVGFVGATGLATAAHLHFEYRLNGVHRNPRTIDFPDAQPIADEYRDEFLAGVGPILAEFERFKRTQLAALAETASGAR